MSVSTIKQAVKSIKNLPEKKRVEVSGWVVKQVAKDTVHGLMKGAVESGAFNALVVEGLQEYAAGKCLKCLHP
jgi:hypothetical protein